MLGVFWRPQLDLIQGTGLGCDLVDACCRVRTVWDRMDRVPVVQTREGAVIVANVSIFPLGQGLSLSAYVSEAIDEVDRSGLDYRVTAMGTIIEGDWDEVMKLIKKMRDRILKKSERIYLNITIDDKNDKRRRLESKIKSVEQKLSKTLRK